MLAVVSIWEPVGVAVVALGLAGGCVKWAVERLDRRFDELHQELERVNGRLDRMEGRRPGRRLSTGVM